MTNFFDNLDKPSLWLKVYASADEFGFKAKEELSPEQELERRTRFSSQYLENMQYLERIKNERPKSQGSIFLDWSNLVEFPVALLAVSAGPAAAAAAAAWAGVKATETGLQLARSSYEKQSQLAVEGAKLQTSQAFMKTFCGLVADSSVPECSSLGFTDSPPDAQVTARAIANRELERISKKAITNISEIENKDAREAALKQFESALNESHTQNLDTIASMTGKLMSLGKDLSEFSEMLESRQKTLKADEAGAEAICGDVDFIKEVVFNQLTPSQQLKAIDSGRYRITSEIDRSKLEIRAKLSELESTAAMYVGGAKQVLVFAQNLEKLGFGINAQDVETATRTVATCELLVQAGLQAGTAYATGSPLGFIGAANCVFAAFSSSSGAESQSAQILAAIQAVQAEIRATRVEIKATIEEFRGDMTERLIAIQKGQDMLTNDVLCIKRQLDGLSESLQSVQLTLDSMQSRLAAFETAVLRELGIIKRNIWVLRTQISDLQKETFGALRLFAESCRKKWPGGVVTNSTSATQFISDEGKENLRNWALTDEALRKIFYGNKEINSVFHLSGQESSNLLDGEGKTDEFIERTWSPIVKFLDKILNVDKSLTSACYSRLFDPVFDIDAIWERSAIFDVDGLSAAVVPFSRSLFDVLNGSFLSQIASDLLVFTPWYELIDDRNNPKGLISGSPLTSASGRCKRIASILSEVKQMLDIAILQLNLLDGDSLLIEMRRVVLEAKGHSKIAFLESKIERLRAALSMPDQEISRYESYLRQDESLAKGYNPDQLDEQVKSCESIIGGYRSQYEKIRLSEVGNSASTSQQELDLYLTTGTTPENASPGAKEVLNNLFAARSRQREVMLEQTNLKDLQESHANRANENSQIIQSLRASKESMSAQIDELESQKSVLRELAVDGGKERVETYELLCNSLRYNQRLSRNLSLFMVYQGLRKTGTKVYAYRAALATSDSSYLADILGLNKTLFPLEKTNTGWQLALKDRDSPDPLFLNLPSATDLVRGIVQHSQELLDLVAMRRRVVDYLNNLLLGQAF